jgi:hypothetical protein
MKLRVPKHAKSPARTPVRSNALKSLAGACGRIDFCLTTEQRTGPLAANGGTQRGVDWKQRKRRMAAGGVLAKEMFTAELQRHFNRNE